MFGGRLRGASVTNLMPVILSLDFSCARASGGKASTPAAIAAAPFRNSRRFIPLPPTCTLVRTFFGRVAPLFRRHQPNDRTALGVVIHVLQQQIYEAVRPGLDVAHPAI